MRIISGKYRGRRLTCPKLVTRPTLDRVREALFSILGELEGRCVVDLYAGSGALGLEALSRGARHVTLVEADRQAARVIRENALCLSAGDAVRIVESKVESCRARLAEIRPIDVVLADPPWKIAQQAALVVPEVVKGLLSSAAVVVIGHAARDRIEWPEGAGLMLEDQRSWGDSALSFLRRSG